MSEIVNSDIRRDRSLQEIPHKTSGGSWRRAVPLFTVVILLMLLLSPLTVREWLGGGGGVAIAEGEFPLAINDALGRHITIAKSPERIISLAPSNTQTLYALNLGDKIVGVTTADFYPAEVTKKEKVGDAFNLDFEKITSLSPDLILAYAFISEKDLKKLEELGLTVVVVKAENISETLELIRLVGKVTGNPQEAAELVDELQARIDKVQTRIKGVPEEKRPRLFYEAMSDNSGIWTTGKGTFQDDLITLAGGVNVAAGLGSGWFAVDAEKILSLDPEVYVAGEAPWAGLTVDVIKRRTGFNVLKAVKEGRVYLINPDIVSQPGPRIVEGLETLASFLYPQFFTGGER